MEVSQNCAAGESEAGSPIHDYGQGEGGSRTSH